MISTERLEEMRRVELAVIQWPFTNSAVVGVAVELADALGELLTRRELDAERAAHQLIVVRRRERMDPDVFGEPGRPPSAVSL